MNDDRDRRIFAQWRDDPNQARFVVDARIADGRIASTWELFGAIDPDRNEPHPFILRRDGAIHFQGGESWRTDLRDAEIRVGGEFRVWFNELDSGVYRIVKIADLGAKGGR